jgi:DNA helicase HerA-like ATPase
VPSLVRELRNPTARCTVVDLGSFDTAQEQRLVADAVLATLWESRLSRQPCLVVIDEAHNICPAEPIDELSRLGTERAVQIAAEGRKYGLYLLTSTQRPHKVHENVVSQCDNLLLMRMNSEADVADLARLLSFVPPGLMAGATSFRMGEALVAGRLLPVPAYVRMGERVSQEGGSDVPPDWAAPRGLPPGEESSPASDVTASAGSQTGG